MNTQHGDGEPEPHQPLQATPERTMQQGEQQAPKQPAETAQQKLYRQLQSLY